jgi:hypothetical protein
MKNIYNHFNKHIIMDDFDNFYNEREQFAIQSSLLIMKLNEMLEKTKKLELKITQELCSYHSKVSAEDFFSPDIDSESQMPPTKKMKK